MRQIMTVVAALAAASLLLSGCAQRMTGSGNPLSPRPAATAARPFSQLQAGPLDAVDFVSDSVGYAGGEGLILKTTDGGQTWLKLYTGPQNVLSIDAVNADQVWAATTAGLLHSSDGRQFHRLELPALDRNENQHIRSIDMVDGKHGFILAGSSILRLTVTAGGAELDPASPAGRVDSMTFLDRKTGFAAGGKLLYKTLDGGRSWQRIFTAPVRTGNDANRWRAAIQAGSAANLWLLIAGGGAGMSQLAYVVFHSNDGRGFVPVLKEAYFASLYPSVQLPAARNLGAQPGPFTVCGSRAVFFIGWYPDQLQLTRSVDDGRTFTRYPIGSQDDAQVPGFFSPMALSFADAAHGWLVGSRRKRGIILYTKDGKNFTAVP